MAEIKKILKNQIYSELKKMLNLKNCYVKVSYENTDEGCVFHIIITIEQMNLNIRTSSVITNEYMSTHKDIQKEILEDVQKAINKALFKFVYRG